VVLVALEEVEVLEQQVLEVRVLRVLQAVLEVRHLVVVLPVTSFLERYREVTVREM
jgi:hypothetical protein